MSGDQGVWKVDIGDCQAESQLLDNSKVDCMHQVQRHLRRNLRDPQVPLDQTLRPASYSPHRASRQQLEGTDTVSTTEATILATYGRVHQLFRGHTSTIGPSPRRRYEAEVEAIFPDFRRDGSLTDSQRLFETEYLFPDHQGVRGSADCTTTWLKARTGSSNSNGLWVVWGSGIPTKVETAFQYATIGVFGQPHLATPSCVKGLLTQANALGFTADCTAWVVVLVSAQDDDEVVGKLLQETFVRLPHVRTLLLAVSGQISAGATALTARFRHQFAQPAQGLVVYSCARGAILPELVVRPARVQDHDDLLPLLQASSQRYPALAMLADPADVSAATTAEEAQRVVEAALSELLAHQGPGHCVLVAEAAGGALVGLMAATTQLDLEPLRGAFDLHNVDDLLYPAAYDTLREVAAKQLECLVQDREEPEAGGDEEGSQPSKPQELQKASEADLRIKMAELRANGLSGEGEALPQGVDLDANAFAITLVLLHADVEPRATEVLVHVFDAMPNKDYCLLTLPSSSTLPPYLAPFTLVPPDAGAVVSENLLLLHRAAMLDLQVRPSKLTDIDSAQQLLDGLPTARAILDRLRNSHGPREHVQVVTCEGHVVAVACLGNFGSMVEARATFDVRPLLGAAEDGDHVGVAVLEHVVVNPVFLGRAPQILARLMQVAGCETLLQYVAPDDDLPPLAHAMEVVRCKHSAGTGAPATATPALLAATLPRVLNPWERCAQRIVVVGGSTTALGMLDTLLTNPEVKYLNITLVTPGPLNLPGPPASPTPHHVARLGLEQHVRVLHGRAEGLDREEQLLELDAGISVPYDVLVLATGLQEHLPEMDPDVLATCIPYVTSLEDLESSFSSAEALELSDIVVYGRSPSAYHALGVLASRGVVLAQKVRHIVPPSGQLPYDQGDLLRDVCAHVGLGLPTTLEATVTSMEGDEGQGRVTLELKGSDGRDSSTSAELVVWCEEARVDPAIVDMVNHTGLVLDGRLVVDANLATADPHVLAAGPVAKFSRRYGRVPYQQNFNSWELGTALAATVSRLCTNPLLHPHQPPPKPTLQRLHRCKVLACSLPGGLHYAVAGSPYFMAAPRLGDVEDDDVVRAGAGRYLTQLVMRDGIIDAILVCTSTKPSPQLLQGLVGMPATTLGDLRSLVATKKVQDIVGALATPSWAATVDPQISLLFESIAVAKDTVQQGFTEQVVEQQVKDMVCRKLEAYSSWFPELVA